MTFRVSHCSKSTGGFFLHKGVNTLNDTKYLMGQMTSNEFSIIKGHIISHFTVPEKTESLDEI